MLQVAGEGGPVRVDPLLVQLESNRTERVTLAEAVPVKHFNVKVVMEVAMDVEGELFVPLGFQALVNHLGLFGLVAHLKLRKGVALAV